MRISRAETGEIEEPRARASVSMLGIQLYEFTHDLTQTWRAGELQKLFGNADDNGTKYDLRLTRGATDYSGAVNGKPVTLPIEAFPNSIWNYGIVDHSLLFNEVDLKLLQVTTTKGSGLTARFPSPQAHQPGPLSWARDLATAVWLPRGAALD